MMLWAPGSREESNKYRQHKGNSRRGRSSNPDYATIINGEKLAMMSEQE